jgi:predicted transposase YbfD/YdcC
MSAWAHVAGEVMARAGNTIRRSLDRADGPGAMPVVSAGAARHALVRAHCTVDEQSHASTAGPARRARLNRHGRVVTIAAMGCQVEITRPMVAQGGASVRSVQDKQPHWHRECEEWCAWLSGPHPVAQAVVLGDDAQVEGGHGRSDTRQGWRTEALEGWGACARWPGLTTLVLVDSTRQVADHERLARRYDLSSLPGTTDAEAKRLSRVIRTPGEIDNRVPWVRDVAMGEEANRPRAGERAQTLA